MNISIVGRVSVSKLIRISVDFGAGLNPLVNESRIVDNWVFDIGLIFYFLVINFITIAESIRLLSNNGLLSKDDESIVIKRDLLETFELPLHDRFCCDFAEQGHDCQRIFHF